MIKNHRYNWSLVLINSAGIKKDKNKSMKEMLMKRGGEGGGGDKMSYRHNFRNNNPIDVNLGRDSPCID